MAQTTTLIYNFLSRQWVMLALAGIALTTFALRVILPLSIVFGDGFTNFLEGDAFSRMYYAKQIQDMPFVQGFAYAVPRGLLFPWIIAMLGYVFPIDIVGAWLPPVLAVGVILIVYLIGAELFNQVVGLLGAIFVSVIPSEFYHRSLLGYPDHHIMEVLLMVAAVYLIIKVIKKRCIFNRYSMGLGVILFMYLANWTGGVLLTGIIGLMAMVLFFSRRYRRNAWALVASAGIGNVLYIALGGFTRYFWWLPINSGNISVSHASGMQAEMLATIFQPLAQRTTSELMPLFAPFGSWDAGVVVSNLHLFVFTFILGGIYLWRWRKDKANLFMIIWTLIIFVLTLNQRRFLYYFTIPVGLVSAWGIYELGQMFKQYAYPIIVVATVVLIIISLPVLQLIGTTRAFSMPPEWHATLEWLDEADTNGGMVTAWSDYGHWIQYMTDKQPNLLNGPGGRDVARLFLSEGDITAKALLNELNTQYLIIDRSDMTYKVNALEVVADGGGNVFTATDASLGNRLLRGEHVPYLELEYQTENIKVYEYITY